MNSPTDTTDQFSDVLDAFAQRIAERYKKPITPEHRKKIVETFRAFGLTGLKLVRVLEEQ